MYRTLTPTLAVVVVAAIITTLGSDRPSSAQGVTPTPRSELLLPPPQFIATPSVGRPIDWNPLDFSILINSEGLLDWSKDAQQEVADEVTPFLAS